MKKYIVNSKRNGTQVILLDDEDYKKLKSNNIKLYVKYHKKIKGCYAYITGGQYKQQTLHRYLLNFPKGKVVDHINHNTLDNRRCNLRVCSDTQNKRNRKDNKSGIVGVDFYNGYWRAQIQHKGKKITKHFKNKKDAISYRKFLELCVLLED